MQPINPFACGVSFFFDEESKKLVEDDTSIKRRISLMTGFAIDRIENIGQPSYYGVDAPNTPTLVLCKLVKFWFNDRQYLLEFPNNSLTVLVDPPLETIEGEEV